MEAVDILGRIDGDQDLGRVELLGQRQLDQDAVDRGVGVEAPDQLQQLGLRRILGELVVEARHAEFDRELALAADVDLAGRIGAHQHRGQAGLGPALGDQIGNTGAHALAQTAREGFSIDQFRISHSCASIRQSGR